MKMNFQPARFFRSSTLPLKKCIPSLTFAFYKKEGLACDQPVPGVYVTRLSGAPLFRIKGLIRLAGELIKPS
jgi:hypothetical protein